MTTTTQTPAAVRDILLEITIDAPPERVWTALVEETHAWWHKDFYTRANPVAFHIQPRLGGWMYEDWGDDSGQIWGSVTGIHAPDFLQVVGDSSPEWGGPNRGIMTWDLKADGNATVVRFRHAIHGNVSDETQGSLTEGWRLLFEGCMKPYAESGARPDAADADAAECSS